ncbi:PulJ/GspJ family protein [Tetzosporium hominis]|uniref:PulJ/GspJ family protein n=1 Tax=Tetzosporium hominis TaxID=2020506 RepID=UPI001FAEED34|nr:prepilin-type N-terminal cleavage/methylation domain-containing protein [Tetzosporium hominis]
MKKQLRNQNGLSLIELLATIVLLSIISLFVFSMFTSSINTYRTNQLNTQLRSHADLLFLQVNNELASVHFDQIKEASTTDSQQLLKKLTISSASYKDCPKYDQSNNLCKDNAIAIELKKVGNKNALVIGTQPLITDTKFEIKDSSGFKVDSQTKLIELILIITYQDTTSRKSQTKEVKFTQTFQPI